MTKVDEPVKVFADFMVQSEYDLIFCFSNFNITDSSKSYDNR